MCPFILGLLECKSLVALALRIGLRQLLGQIFGMRFKYQGPSSLSGPTAGNRRESSAYMMTVSIFPCVFFFLRDDTSVKEQNRQKDVRFVHSALLHVMHNKTHTTGGVRGRM